MNSIGAMRQRLVLEQEQRVADGGGGYILSWQTFATVWAVLEPVAVVETLAAGRQEMQVTHQARMRWRSGVQPAMRARVGTRVFAITGVRDEGERRHFLRLDLVEGSAG